MPRARAAVAVLIAALWGWCALAAPASGHGRDRHDAGAQHSLRGPVTDENFYFVMADRFDNGDTANDDGGLGDDPLVSGFDPTRKGFYNGGDLKGLLKRIDYIQGLGTTSIWLTPSFKNKAVQLGGRPVRRLPRLLDHRLHPDRPAPGHQRRPRGAHRRRARARHEGLLRHHHQPHRRRDRLRRAARARPYSRQGRRALHDGRRRSRSTTATTPARTSFPALTPTTSLPLHAGARARPRRTSRCRPGSTTSRSTTTAATPPSSARTPTTATSSASTTCSPSTRAWCAA